MSCFLFPVVKEPPFTIKESGYAGFIFPIEIHLKNKDEPKKITFTYDFTLQQSGFLKDRYIFPNPNEDFKKKLLKGGGILTNNSYYTNPDQESQSRSRDSFSEEKQQLLSKPKLSSENVKKHKAKEHKDEVPHRTSSFVNLFGPPLQKPPKVSPDPKKLEKNALPTKSDKKEKERSSSDKKSKHEHKESKTDKVKIKEEKEKAKQEKKNYNKEQEKSKDKANKRPSERPPSPDIIKKSRSSPKRPPSPPPRSSSASSMKEEYKAQKHTEPAEPRKPKPEEKPPEPKPDKEQKEKKKKEKKSHDRDKERKERKEHKKENHKRKESPVSKELSKETPKEVLKARDTPKEKEPTKDTTPAKEKQYKPEKAINKFSLENLQKTPPSADIEERSNHHKNKDKSDSERKHKHKKKDKKRDESKEKHKESSKEKKHKHEKVKETPVEKPEVIEHRETPIPKEPPHQELCSPISIDTASQCSSKSGLAKTSQVIDDINSSHSDSESSMIADDDDKSKLNNISPEPIKEPSPEPEPEPEPELEVEPEMEPIVEVPPPQPKEKSKKHKEKSSKREEKREEKRRKRKAAEDEDSERKVAKSAVVAEPGPAFIEMERGESSGSVTTETKVQDNGVSSSLGEDAEPGDLSPDYMVQLRDLQQRIMKIKNNEDLERVVNLIAETGRYEVTTQTFDFDLCLLDRSTVQQLIQLVGC